MNVRYVLILFLIAFLTACGGGETATTDGADTDSEATTEESTETGEDEATESEAADEEEAETTEADSETAAESEAAPADDAEEAAGSDETAEEEATDTEATEDEAATEETEPEPTEEMVLSPDLDFPEEDINSTDSGLQYVILEEGEGEESPEEGEIVQVHYTGMLQNGDQFDSSLDRGEPIQFPLGLGRVIPGWDEGIGLMSVGDTYMLIIPPELGYEDQVVGLIPPNSTLYFEVELLDILPGAPEAPAEVDEDDYTETDNGLLYYDLEEGEGATPEEGERVTVHFTAWFEESGELLDSSYFQGDPFTFPVGIGQVMPGWDEGMTTMQVGSKRQMVIPPDLAYGEEGFRDVIPPNTTIVLEVELLEIQEGPPTEPTEVDEDDYTETDSGLMYYDLEEGDGGDTPEEGDQVTVHYTGWLEDGTMFDSSLSRGEPFTFPLGAGQVIPGWDEGVATMEVGAVRQLVIPPELGYGEQGAGGTIPPNATLIFEVELLEFESVE